ncbi:RNHCP domain-containing protein [Bacillus thuringiensis]|uniref:RNHCP domain-containing protein n=1 Tax=Bacillus thuringiensis TaxID=1428 RepID=UPI000BFC16AC|nr:RNHCP domain-containing protein [Bacillus thuringiensis]PGM47119.1 hypothetical protein CN949_26775 [Bacillus thuringiensis]
MKIKKINEGFTCISCGIDILPLDNGSSRNHCPFCLTSIHLDIIPGDRLSMCTGEMKAIELEYHSKKGYQILHKCTKCNEIRKNKIAENCVQPDNLDKLIALNKSEILV